MDKLGCENLSLMENCLKRANDYYNILYNTLVKSEGIMKTNIPKK